MAMAKFYNQINPRLLLPGILLLLIVLAVISRYDQASGQKVGEFKINLRTEPNPAAVGEVTLIASIRERNGQLSKEASVWFTYFQRPPEYMVPHEGYAIKVAATAAENDTYQAKVNFDRAGVWKVAVILRVPSREEVVAWFDVMVK